MEGPGNITLSDKLFQKRIMDRYLRRGRRSPRLPVIYFRRVQSGPRMNTFHAVFNIYSRYLTTCATFLGRHLECWLRSKCNGPVLRSEANNLVVRVLHEIFSPNDKCRDTRNPIAADPQRSAARLVLLKAGGGKTFIGTERIERILNHIGRHAFLSAAEEKRQSRYYAAYYTSSFPESLYPKSTHETWESALRQAQGDNFASVMVSLSNQGKVSRPGRGRMTVYGADALPQILPNLRINKSGEDPITVSQAATFSTSIMTEISLLMRIDRTSSVSDGRYIEQRSKSSGAPLKNREMPGEHASIHTICKIPVLHNARPANESPLPRVDVVSGHHKVHNEDIYSGKRELSAAESGFDFPRRTYFEKELGEIKKTITDTRETVDRYVKKSLNGQDDKPRIDLSAISDQVYRNIERRIRFERERRGI